MYKEQRSSYFFQCQLQNNNKRRGSYLSKPWRGKLHLSQKGAGCLCIAASLLSPRCLPHFPHTHDPSLLTWQPTESINTGSSHCSACQLNGRHRTHTITHTNNVGIFSTHVYAHISNILNEYILHTVLQRKHIQTQTQRGNTSTRSSTERDCLMEKERKWKDGCENKERQKK